MLGLERFLKRFLNRGLNYFALILVAAVLIVAAAAPRLAPQPIPADPVVFNVVGDPRDPLPRPPGPGQPLGTISGGVDVYFTLVWGTRTALVFGLGVAAVTALVGVLVGAVSGYAGGWAQMALMRLTDAMLSVPLLAGVWLIGGLLLPPNLARAEAEVGWSLSAVQHLAVRFGWSSLSVGLILFMWMPYARLTNDNVRRIRDAEFVTAARALGVSGAGILFRHLLPNAVAPALVLLARDVGAVVVIAAAFTFIGIQGGPEWGELLVISRQYVLGLPGNPLAYWWVYLPLTVALILFSTAWNLLGDGINQAMNPRE
jgi:peptide/nickel transport system permease protein